MKQPKQYYKELELPEGWKWAFFDNMLHSFVKEFEGGWGECKVTERDIETGNHILMMNRQLTRK